MPAAHDEFFGDFKQCQYCHKPLPRAYEGDLCPNCKEQALFHEVKDYIRANHVNEYEVAEHFQIPLRQVKDWIQDGRIEYNLSDDSGGMTNVHCHNCGAPVAFGTLCPKCLKQMNRNIRGYGSVETNKDHKMRFLDPNQQK